MGVSSVDLILFVGLNKRVLTFCCRSIKGGVKTVSWVLGDIMFAADATAPRYTWVLGRIPDT